MLQSINPASNTPIQSYTAHTDQQVLESIQSAQNAFENWGKVPLEKRCNQFKVLADYFRQNKAKLGQLITEEMGKIKPEAEAEIEKCAWACDYYAEHAIGFLQDTPIQTDAQKSYTSYQPLGVLLAIMPWNFPFWQALRFAVPSLIVGNVALLKHASNVCGCSLAIEQAFKETGFEQNVFQSLLIPANKTEQIIAHPFVQGVSLTGSTQAGQAVAQIAGKHLKKCVLELGGSDPYIILEDVDLDLAATACVTSRLLNTGQSCIAAKRFIALDNIYDTFCEKVINLMGSYEFGDPKQTNIQLGPMANQKLRDELHQQVLDSIELGAKCLLGGEIPNKQGAYYPPTVLANLKPGMPAYDQELFGPVASLISASSLEQAIQIANSTSFGLGGAVFTQNIQVGEDIAKTKIQAGNCFVNAFVKSDPRLPFGGIKQSGYGRELSKHGLLEFTNIKTVYIQNG